MKKVTIAFDIDDTLTRFSKQKELLEREFNIRVPEEGYGTYCFGESIGITKKQEVEFWDKHLVELIEDVEPNGVYEEIMSAFLPFKKSEYSVLIITARDERYRAATINWLNKNDIKFDSLIMTAGASKCDLIKSMNINYFVEDNPNFFKEVVEKGLSDECVYIKNSRPNNQESFSYLTLTENKDMTISMTENVNEINLHSERIGYK